MTTRALMRGFAAATVAAVTCAASTASAWYVREPAGLCSSFDIETGGDSFGTNNDLEVQQIDSEGSLAFFACPYLGPPQMPVISATSVEIDVVARANMPADSYAAIACISGLSSMFCGLEEFLPAISAGNHFSLILTNTLRGGQSDLQTWNSSLSSTSYPFVFLQPESVQFNQLLDIVGIDVTGTP